MEDDAPPAVKPFGGEVTLNLGGYARVSRGITTGNKKLFVMTLAGAKKRGVERFVRPILDGSASVPRHAPFNVIQSEQRHVVILATPEDVASNKALSDYLRGVKPRVAAFEAAPIVATFVGIPRFAANLDDFVVPNTLYCIRPREKWSHAEILASVELLNAAAKHAFGARSALRLSPSELAAMEI